MDTHEHTILNQTFVLTTERALFWLEKNILLLSDLHLGKIGHFRKSGIALPSFVHEHDLQRLNHLIEKFNPRQIMFLGDLFHSDHNLEWELFIAWIREHQGIGFLLVKGNHDIMDDNHYQEFNFHLVKEKIEVGPFIFSHKPLENKKLYNIAGHIHPAVRLAGRGRQSITVPCYYFGNTNGLLPSFGKFTGSHPVNLKAGEQAFLIANEKLIPYP